LAGIIAYFDRFILIGDHFQLPAVCCQKPPHISPDIAETIGIKSLTDSLFERLYRRCKEKNWDDAYDLLPEHFRMHNDIAMLVNTFYEDKLSTAQERQFEAFEYYQQDRQEVPKLYSYLRKSRTIFIPTAEKVHIRYNEEEAEKVVSIVKTIFDNKQENFTEKTIGVICAWRMQVNLINSKMSKYPFASKVTVDTVERFQGSEREVIIYSTAVSSPELMKNLQSLTIDNTVDRKLNVAISRAIEQFILLGNKDILMKSKHYKRVLEMCHEV